MATSLGTRIFTLLNGREVGRDAAGNRYYRAKRAGHTHHDSLRHERRWVIYKGEVEATKVPPEWHAWLHHTTDEAPPANGVPRRPWMKDHRPNQTGTPQAYRPQGHTLKGGQRPKATGDYEPWQPN